MEVRTRQREHELLIALVGGGSAPEALRSATPPLFPTRDDGSGRGLSLCARILDEHGARLEIAGGVRSKL